MEAVGVLRLDLGQVDGVLVGHRRGVAAAGEVEGVGRPVRPRLERPLARLHPQRQLAHAEVVGRPPLERQQSVGRQRHVLAGCGELDLRRQVRQRLDGVQRLAEDVAVGRREAEAVQSRFGQGHADLERLPVPRDELPGERPPAFLPLEVEPGVADGPVCRGPDHHLAAADGPERAVVARFLGHGRVSREVVRRLEVGELRRRADAHAVLVRLGVAARHLVPEAAPHLGSRHVG